MNKTYYFKLFFFIGIGFGQEIIGSIKDKITQAPLNGVNITVENLDYGVSSDKFGNYMLDVSPFEADQIVKFQHIISEFVTGYTII
jgi:hypothetical protein